ncbi:MAG TPA: hypothetical protein DIS76_00165 [Rhodospirillaceae bacterium]|nr:hypothetical protein [Rhodospirillaceae bacterium]
MVEKLALSENFTDPTQQFDLSFVPAVQVSKLDADQYMAEDLEGSHETVFGSGNMNFLAMQAAQTNETLENVSAHKQNNLPDLSTGIGNPTEQVFPITSNGNAENNFSGYYSRATEPSTGSGGNALLLNGNGQNQSSAPQVTRSSPDIGNTNGLTGTNNGNSGIGMQGTNGQSAPPAQNGMDGINGNPGTGTTIVNHNTFIDLGDVTNLIDSTTTNLFDTINNTTDNLTEIINNITDVNLLQEATHIVNNLLGDTDTNDHDIGLGLGIANNLLNTDALQIDIHQLLNPVEDIIGDFDIGLNSVLDLFGNNETDNAAGDTDLTALLQGDLLDNNLLNTNLGVALDAVENLTGDIDLDLTAALNLLGPLAAPLIDNYMGGEDSPLTAINEVLTDATSPLLGPLLGDTNFDLDGNINLLSGGSINNTAGDTDINLGLAPDLLDLNNIVSDIPLDAVEVIVGDIDLNPTATLDVANNIPGVEKWDHVFDTVLDTTHQLDMQLDQITQLLDTHQDNGTFSLFDTLCDAGSPEISAWPESIISPASNLINDTHLGGALHALPDPVGDITGGLSGVIDQAHANSSIVKFGGLFG